MVEPPRGAFQHLRVDGIAAGPECDDAAHAGALYCTRAVTDSGGRAGLGGVEVHRVGGKAGARRQPSGIEAATPSRGEGTAHRARNTARRMPEPSPGKVRLPLARDPCRLDAPEDARRALATVYDSFTEGFDTRDLSETRALLAELA